VPTSHITLAVDPFKVDALAGDDAAGPALATLLREAADAIERDIQIVPWPGGEWTTEVHHVTAAVTLTLA
jgi:hypothetical protein